MDENVILDVGTLSATYGEREILHEVDFRVQRGEIMVILGGSGCGKSTLLRHIIGLHEPSSGSVRLFGEDIHALDVDARTDLLARVGFLFQQGGLFNSMSLYDNLAFPLRERTGLAERLVGKIIRTYLTLVGLGDAVSKFPSELSGGMKKRAGLARALVLQPEIVLCDEPSAGLDPITAAGVDDLLLSLRDTTGAGFLVVTHEMSSAQRIADRVIMLHQGRVVASGAFAEIKKSTDPYVRQFMDRQFTPETH